MNIGKIIRSSEMEGGYWGQLVANGQLLGMSMEREWAENLPFHSCIPPGTYECFRRDTWKRRDKYGHTYQVTGAEGRTDILFHPATWPDQLAGCISMGEYRRQHEGKLAIMHSSNVFERFVRVLNGCDKFILIILEVR